MNGKSFALKASSKLVDLTPAEMQHVSGGDVKDKRKDKNPNNDCLIQKDVSGDNWEWVDDF